MLASVLILAAGAMSPQVQTCAAAVRADSPHAVEACQPPKINLFAAEVDQISSECMAAMKAGQATRKVPAKVRWTMIRNFEAAMAKCAAPVEAAEIQERETVKLSD